MLYLTTDDLDDLEVTIAGVRLLLVLHRYRGRLRYAIGSERLLWRSWWAPRA